MIPRGKHKEDSCLMHSGDSLLELLMSSKPHRDLLVKVLNEAHVAQDMSVEGFEGIAITSQPTITSLSLKRKSSPRREGIIGLYMCRSNAWNTLWPKYSSTTAQA